MLQEVDNNMQKDIDDIEINFVAIFFHRAHYAHFETCSSNLCVTIEYKLNFFLLLLFIIFIIIIY